MNLAWRSAMIPGYAFTLGAVLRSARRFGERVHALLQSGITCDASPQLIRRSMERDSCRPLKKCSEHMAATSSASSSHIRRLAQDLRHLPGFRARISWFPTILICPPHFAISEGLPREGSTDAVADSAYIQRVFCKLPIGLIPLVTLRPCGLSPDLIICSNAIPNFARTVENICLSSDNEN